MAQTFSVSDKRFRSSDLNIHALKAKATPLYGTVFTRIVGDREFVNY